MAHGTVAAAVAVHPRSSPADEAQGDPRLVILRNQDDVRRWLKEAHGQSPDAAAGIERISTADALALRRDDPELATIIERALSLGLPVFESDEVEIDAMARDLLPAPVSRRLGVLPIVASGQLLAVLMSDVEAGHTVEFIVRHRVVPILARPNLINRGLSTQYDRTEDEAMIRRLGLDARGGVGSEVQQLEAERLSTEQPVVKIIADVIDRAIQRRASDIHIRPGQDTFELLYRIDGDLVPIRRFLPALLPAFVSRIKVIGGMNLAEHRVPQDGRASATSGDMNVDLRISVIPTIHGEAVVIRILNTAFGCAASPRSASARATSSCSATSSRAAKACCW